MAYEDFEKGLIDKYGVVWTTEQLTMQFEVTSFLAPFVFVTDKATGRKGTMQFTHMPRFYFDFKPTD